jgi:hypothetical protein
MKKLTILAFAMILLAACGKSKTGLEYAEEVCDCSSKANALPVSDPGRTKAQDDCLKMNQDVWAKVKNMKTEHVTAYNKKLSECATTQIKKSFGQ